MNRTIKDSLAQLMLALAFGLCGCAGGLFGTGVGDGKVSDGEAALINAGGGMYGVSGAGTKAQGVLGSPSKATGPQFPLQGVVTQHFDSVGTATVPPYGFKLTPIYGTVTGTYGAAKAPAQSAVDPALVQAVLDALGRPPASSDAGGPSVPVPTPAATPAAGGDAGGPITPAIRAVMQ